MRLSALMFVLATAAPGADDWDLPPLRYTDSRPTDALARLVAADGRLAGTSPLERLAAVLDLLDISATSQTLVFSKTSLQTTLISPDNPRALFFNENAYVGYVPGGIIEVALQDAALGMVFYAIETTDSAPPERRIRREVASCLACHATARTESVPGVLVRSVFPDRAGQPVLAHGSFLIDHASPLGERWGGYYVTGTSSLPHLGNRMFDEGSQRPAAAPAVPLTDLTGKIAVHRYPRATSDIVALMLLEHQCAVHNQLNAAAIQFRRHTFLSQSLGLDATANPDRAAEITARAATRIVDLLLFKDEAPLGADGIDGCQEFQRTFTARFPKTPEGYSLADFNLYERLFKHRCSYMVYSSAFTHLPAPLKTAILTRLRTALTPSTAGQPPIAPHLSRPEQDRLHHILRATLPAYRNLPD